MKNIIIVLKILVVVFLAEAAIMHVLARFGDSLPLEFRIVVDSVLLILLSGPIISFWVVKPYIQNRDLSEESLKNSRDHFEKFAEDRLRAFLDGEVERRRTEREIRESETRFIKAFRASPGLFAISDPDTGIHLDVNEAWCKTFGYSREEAIGKSANEMGIWVDLEERRRMVAIIAEKGRIQDFETRLKARDGTIGYFLISGETIEIDGKKRLLLVGHDFTDRKRMEEAIGESEQSIRRLNEGLEKRTYDLIEEAREREKAQRALQESTALVGLLHSVAVAANEAQGVEQAIGVVLHNLCSYTWWPVGHAFMADPENGEMLISTDLWHIEGETRFKEFREGSVGTLCAKGEGLVGRVFATGRPEWIADLGQEKNFKRAALADQSGFKSAFAMPVLIGSEVKGVLEFFTTERVEADQSLFYILVDIGTQLGHVMERFAAEREMRKLSTAVEQNPASIIITDTDGMIEYVNAQFIQISGYSAAEAIGKKPSILKSGVHDEDFYADLWATILSGKSWNGEFNNRRKDGNTYWVSATIFPIKGADGKVQNFLGMEEDISLQKEYEDRLLHQAHYDHLTGLPNRLLAIDRLSQALANAHRRNKNVALMSIGLDGFTRISDSLGYKFADTLLQAIAERFGGCVREGDTIAHLGGDEFLLVMPDLVSGFHAEHMAARIIQECRAPVSIGGREIVVTSRVGITLAPGDADDPHLLLRNAHAAMSRARSKGGDTYAFFSPDMDRSALERLHRESLLRRALGQGEFSLHYQPLINAETHDVIGAEALLRWNNPELGPVSPDTFIPMAEETGLILAIGDWVLKEACRQAKLWNALSDRHFRVAVNVSSRQIVSGQILTSVAETLKATGLPSDCLELEITEHMLMEDVDVVTRTLNKLKEMGIALSIDDFGTGYSALSYLKQFPFTSLKIDRAFIAGVASVPEDAALAGSIISMAHGMGLKVIAEGVETEAQLDFVTTRKTDIIQGYHFGRPVAPEIFRESYLPPPPPGTHADNDQAEAAGVSA